MATAPHQLPPTIDPSAAQRWARAAPAAAPWLHEEVARRMQERLGWIRLAPRAWADWEAVRGGIAGHRLVAHRYPDAVGYVQEGSSRRERVARAALTPAWWSPQRWRRPKLRFDAPGAAAVQMVWANMALHMSADPETLIGQWQRTLATDGFVMFSCLGPDTLRELRGLYHVMGWPEPAHEFTDMHDWGDMLVHAGFAEPVMDMERIVLTYADAQALLRDLRELGRNLHPSRFAALRGRQWRDQLLRALAQRLADPAQGGRLALTFEIIYGHAFKAPPKVRLEAQSAVSLDDMRAMLNEGRPVRERPATGH